MNNSVLPLLIYMYKAHWINNMLECIRSLMVINRCLWSTSTVYSEYIGMLIPKTIKTILPKYSHNEYCHTVARLLMIFTSHWTLYFVYNIIYTGGITWFSSNSCFFYGKSQQHSKQSLARRNGKRKNGFFTTFMAGSLTTCC